jgi:hypothetical protein
MNCSKLALVISLAFLLGSCANPVPSSNLAQVKGVLVTKGTNGPIKDVILRLWKVTGTENGIETSSVGHPISEATTDATGAFLFINVPSGRYLLDGVWEVEAWEVFLKIGKYRGHGVAEESAIEVAAGQTNDLGILEHCPYQYCGLPPTVIPTAVR